MVILILLDYQFYGSSESMIINYINPPTRIAHFPLYQRGIKGDLRSYFIFSLLVFVSLFPIHSYSQDESIFEQIFEDYEDNENENQIIEIIDYYRRRKIDLLDCKLNQLAALPLISTIESYNYLNLQRKYPQLKRTDIADSLDMSEMQKYILMECTKIGKEEKGKVYVNFRSRLIYNIEKERGFTDSIYTGDESDIYNRLLIDFSNFTIGGLSKKNRGEEFGNAFSSGFLQYQNFDFNLIVGDFIPNFGAGGIMWQSYGARKGLDVIRPTVNIGNGIYSYKSSMDIGFFRGIAAEKQIAVAKNDIIKLSFFFSDAARSATIDSNGYASSIYTSGYFRTENEISKRNKLNEKAIGGNIEYYNDRFRFGANMLSLNYDRTITSNSGAAFSGKNGFLHSYYFNLNLINFAFMSELSIDAMQNLIIKSGIQTKFRNIDIALYYRNIGENFRSPFGYAFGEFSNPENEEGFYTGISFNIIRELRFNFYADIYNTKKRTFYVPARVTGLDLFGEINYRINSRNLLTLRVRNESKTDNINISTSKSLIGQATKSSARIEIESNIAKYFKLRVRTEANNIDYDGIIQNESGLLFFADIKWNPRSFFDIGARFTQFSTDSYASAIWQFEYLANGYMRNIALDGQGNRFYIYGNFELIKNINITLRYSVSTYNNVSSIGTSYSEIEGNNQSQVFLQLDYRW